MTVRVYESVTRVPLIAHEPALRRGWTPFLKGSVRVWREEASLAAACEADNSDIFACVTALGPEATPRAIIEAIEALGRVRAIEVLDEAGAGARLYLNQE